MLTDKVLYDGDGVHIEETSPTQVLVTTSRKLNLLLWYGFSIPILGVCALLSIAGFSQVLSVAPNGNLTGPLCVGSIFLFMMIMILVLWLLSIIGLYTAIYERRLLIDVDRAICVFLGAPGLSCEFAFDEIESVSLCTGSYTHWHFRWLCLSIRGHKRFFRIQYIARDKNLPEASANDFRTAADVLSRLIGCPVRTYENVLPWQMSWR